MTEVHIVTSGSYSDYHIVAVYSDLETATMVSDRMYASRVESYTLDELDPEQYRLPFWRVQQDVSGRIQARTHHAYGRVKNINTVKYLPLRIMAHSGLSSDIEMCAVVSASTEDDAIKIAADLFAQHRATRAGIT